MSGGGVPEPGGWAEVCPWYWNRTWAGRVGRVVGRRRFQSDLQFLVEFEDGKRVAFWGASLEAAPSPPPTENELLMGAPETRGGG